MQHIVFITVGRVKTSFFAEACDHYAQRLKKGIHLEMVEVPAGKNFDPKKYAEEESKKLLEKAKKYEGDVWLLDEKGQEMTSLEFAQTVENSRDIGRTIIFILGGAFGVTDELKKSVDHLLRLSDMTFPHELCQLVFLEQLYRAIEIQKNSGYHH